MKSELPCPACACFLDVFQGHLRCQEIHCKSEVCRNGVFFDVKWGEDVNFAYDQLKARFERAKEGASK